SGNGYCGRSRVRPPARFGHNSASTVRLRHALMDTRQVVARNYSEASENRIHSDEIAQRYGFRGALVPGVAVYGFLTRPMVDRVGEEWLARSTSDLRLLKP